MEILCFDSPPEYLGKLENTSYRECLRRFFKMQIEEENVSTEIDDESRDELLYDTVAVKNGLEYIYQQTKDDALFIVLYQLSAGQMLSENEEIGLAILFSYDFFHLFYHCLHTFFKSPDKWSSTCESYRTLYCKIQRN